MQVVDRCTTCHQGITRASLADASVPQPFRAHPPIPHRVRDWGCVVCHRGQGLATNVRDAHETTLAWEQPVCPSATSRPPAGPAIALNCRRHRASTEAAKLLLTLNCVGCHRLQGVERPPMLGPDLTNVGTKVSRAWIYKWLKDPRTITASDGSVLGEWLRKRRRAAHAQVPAKRKGTAGSFRLSQHARSEPIPSYKFDPKMVAAWEKRPDLSIKAKRASGRCSAPPAIRWRSPARAKPN